MAAAACEPRALAWREQRRWERVAAVEEHGLLLALTRAEERPEERG